MKKLILSLCLFTCVYGLMAQLPAYLDVKVSESLERQPTSMEYHLRVNPENGEYDLDRDFEAQRKVMRSRIKENEGQLKQFLDANKVKYTLNRDETYAISQEEMPFSIFKIKVNNKTELDNLLILLRQLNYVEGNIGDKIYPPVQNDEINLFEKLYNKARSKAEKMASIMNCTLGKILEAEELDQKDLDYYGMVEEGSYEHIYGIQRGNPLSSTTVMSMRFRFELVKK
ncbi:MAG: hypothetical protein SFV55_29135 [Haliscomenobacter sp.]|uniref:hypothetical protein n=1 Tax=Haliscomenobacter sp. TaxID=2717303 RepID=UPI0029A64432|nr:hypothetical protein [Haliscomenobacter sp.]MDX2072534.1 hypothetical protein [Haliscomenobacter sp.]